MRGRFITFEGGEGAGKSTQVRLLSTALQSVGHQVVTTREPGGSPTAEAIRGLLLSGRAKPLGTLGEAYLFAAARIDHLEETIRPALARGDFVICDRFMDSTRVYQGTAGTLDAAVIDRIEAAAVGDTRPDLTVIIDVPVAVGLGRVRARSGLSADRFEADEVAVHEARRAGFLALAAWEPTRCVVVDGTDDPNAVAGAVLAAVSDRLGIVLPTEA
ncbi:dTMP kinase [Mongoliimonas terrestris]|uniref:dTMP kinase n=1 Tax=Mongoliimonas terrestris TaxID=1709001 RepID=UPI000949B096|nr:dTMP kinase [Mongoliimonas terrestris]